MASSTVTPESEHEARVSEVEHFLSSPSSIALHRNAHESSASVVAGASLPCRVMISPSSNEANATAGSIRSAELVARAHSDSRRKLSDMWSGASSATEPEDRRGGEPARPLRNTDSPPLASPAVMPPVSPNCFLTEFNEIFYHSQKRDLPREKGDDDNQATGQEVARVKDSEEGLKRMVLGGWGEKIGPDVVTVFTMYDGPKAKGKKKIAQKQKKASPDKKGGDPALVELVSTASTESRAEKTLLGKTKQRQGSLGNKRKDAFPTSSRILKQKEIGLVGRSGFAGKRASAKTKSRESVDKIKERRKGGGEVPNLKLVHKVVNNLMDEFKGLPEPKQPPEKASNNSSAALYTPHSTPVAETALLPKKPKGRWSSKDTSFAATAQLKMDKKGRQASQDTSALGSLSLPKGKKGRRTSKDASPADTAPLKKEKKGSPASKSTLFVETAPLKTGKKGSPASKSTSFVETAPLKKGKMGRRTSQDTTPLKKGKGRRPPQETVFVETASLTKKTNGRGTSLTKSWSKGTASTPPRKSPAVKGSPVRVRSVLSEPRPTESDIFSLTGSPVRKTAFKTGKRQIPKKKKGAETVQFDTGNADEMTLSPLETNGGQKQQDSSEAWGLTSPSRKKKQKHDKHAQDRLEEEDNMMETSSTASTYRSPLDRDNSDEKTGQDGSETVVSCKPVYVLKDPTFGHMKPASVTTANERLSRLAWDKSGFNDEYREVSPSGVTQKSEWTQGDTREEVPVFSKISKVEGLNIEVDTSSSQGSQGSRRTKMFYCEGQKPSLKGGSGRPLATIKTCRSIFKHDQHGKQLLSSESSASIYDCPEGSSVLNVRVLPARPHQRRSSGKGEQMTSRRSSSIASFQLCPSHSSHKARTKQSRSNVHRFLCDSVAASPYHSLREVSSLKPALRKPLRRCISIDTMEPSISLIEVHTDESTVLESTTKAGHRKPLCTHFSRSSINPKVRRPPASRNIRATTPGGPSSASPLPIRTLQSFQCIKPRKPVVQTSYEAPAIRIEAGIHSRQPTSYNRLQPISSCSTGSPAIFNKNLPAPQSVQIAFSPSGFAQSDNALRTSQGAPSQLTVTSGGGSFATARAFSGTEAPLPSSKIIFNGQVVEGPSATFQVPALSDDPAATVVVQTPTTVVINDAPDAPSLPGSGPTSSTQQVQPHPVTTEKFSHTVESFQVGHSVGGFEAGSSGSSSSHVSIVHSVRFPEELDNETIRDRLENKTTGSTVDGRANDSYSPWRENIKRRGNVVLYVVLLLSTLFAITAGSVLYAKRRSSAATAYEDEDAEGRQVTWLLGAEFKGDAGRAMYTKSRPCQSASCSERVAKLLGSLDGQVRPCQTFYGHVCSHSRVNGTADKQMAQLTESRLASFFKGRGSTDMILPVASAARRLWRDCIDLAMLNQLGKLPLQALLKLTGLGGWPYGATGTRPDAWKVAGDLLRLMALAPLLDISGLANGTLRLSPGNHGRSHDAADVLDTMLTVRPRDEGLRELAEDVADLGRQLNTLRDRHAQEWSGDERDQAEVLPKQFVEAALIGLRRDAFTVHAQSAAIIGPLVKLVRDSKPQAVLNMLGYWLVRHVDLFTPAVVEADLNSGEASRRESRCSRAVLDDALSSEAAEYVRYAALRSHLDLGLVRTLATHLKHSFLDKLTDLTWLDGSTRKSAQALLRDLKVRFFYERYGDANKSTPVHPPAALRSKALAMYQRFREVRFRSRLLQGATADDIGDEHCVLDTGQKVLFLRLSAVDVRDAWSPLWPMMQAAYMGPRLSRCLLRVLLPAAEKRQRRRDVHWSSAARWRLNATRTCLHDQHANIVGSETPWSPAQAELAVVDNAALRPARDLFDEYLARMDDNALMTEPTEEAVERQLSWHQVFYVAYAQSLCEDPDHRRRQAQRNTRWERVNGPLSNDPAFHRAFGCNPGDPMRPEPTCASWSAPP